MKQGLLVVSFGTSYKNTLEKNIVTIEQELKETFPNRMFLRGFTSSRIIKKWKERDQIHIFNITESLDFFLKNEVEDVLIQPTHVIPGEEYYKILNLSSDYQSKFKKLTIGSPLLGKSDYKKVANAILPEIPPQSEGNAFIFMGHGTEHKANSAYDAIEKAFHRLGRNDIFIGTVEDRDSLAELEIRIKNYGQVQNIELRPFMIVAGDHAENDMASEKEDSWKSILEKQGYSVTFSLKGLGEYPEIRRIFKEYAQKSLENQEESQ